MPISFPLLTTGSFLILFLSINLEADSTSASSPIVIKGPDITSLASITFKSLSTSIRLFIASLSVIIPFGLSPSITITEPILNLTIFCTASLSFESGLTVLIFLLITSLTKTKEDISSNSFRQCTH